MTGFPLLKLPLVPLLYILKEMHIFDLLNFSQISKRALHLSRLARRQVDCLSWEFFEETSMICVDVPESLDMFIIHFDENANEEDEEGDERITFEGYEFIHRDNNWIYNVVDQRTAIADAEQLFVILSTRLKELVRATKFEVDFEVSFTVDCPLWSIQKEFDRFFFNCDPLTVEAIQFVVANIRIDLFHAVNGMPLGFTFTEALPFKNLKIDTVGWLDNNALLTMQHENVEIRNHSLPLNLINGIVKNWVEGELPKLETFKMDATHADRDQILRECLEGVKIDPRPRQLISREKIIRERDYEMGMGVNFKSLDGNMATIEVFENNVFLFVAW